MRVEIGERGVLTLPGGASASPGFLLNAVLGLRDEPAYLAWMEEQLPGAVTKATMRRWIREAIPGRLRQAARRSARGRIPLADIGEDLQRVRFERDAVEVPSLPVLAAFALAEEVKSGAVANDCPECGYPWFSHRTKLLYCNRPAPSRRETCNQLHKHERFAAQRKEWNKEYRRIYARKFRDSVSDEDWQAWRDDPFGSADAPDNYLPFDVWQLFRRQVELRDRMKNLKVQDALAEIRAVLTALAREKEEEHGNDH